MWSDRLRTQAFSISSRRNDRYPDRLMTGRIWPGRAKAGFKLAAVNRPPKAIQRGKSWPDLQRPVMAGCVRSRTAASEQRNSWNPWVPDRQLCGSRNDRSGSGRDSRSRLAALPRRCELEVSVRPSAARPPLHNPAILMAAGPRNLSLPQARRSAVLIPSDGLVVRRRCRAGRERR